jgi:hypothetical protein
MDTSLHMLRVAPGAQPLCTGEHIGSVTRSIQSKTDRGEMGLEF